jgi:hypothetical protein
MGEEKNSRYCPYQEFNPCRPTDRATGDPETTDVNRIRMKERRWWYETQLWMLGILQSCHYSHPPPHPKNPGTLPIRKIQLQIIKKRHLKTGDEEI